MRWRTDLCPNDGVWNLAAKFDRLPSTEPSQIKRENVPGPHAFSDEDEIVMSTLIRLFLPFTLLLLPIVACDCDCEDDGGFPSSTRVAPSVLVVPPNESVRYEIRGCVARGADRVASGETGVIEASPSVRSESMGTALLTLPLTEPSEGEGELVAREVVLPGHETNLSLDHAFFELQDIHGYDRLEKCSEWFTVEFGWMDVEGIDALEVTWQSYFVMHLDSPEGIKLAIDFLTPDRTDSRRRSLS